MKPDYIWIAEKELGVKEIVGKQHNPRIIEYDQSTKLKSTDDETAWCSAFVNWVMMKAGYERSHSAAARSWLGVGIKLEKFEPYCIVVFKRGKSWQGHVTFGISDMGETLHCLGGNQHNSVCYANYPKTDVLGYFRPVRIIDTGLT